MIQVVFTVAHTEQHNFGNVVVLNGTPGTVTGSTLFEGEVKLEIATKGFRTGFKNPALEDVTVREVPVDFVEFSEF